MTDDIDIDVSEIDLRSTVLGDAHPDDVEIIDANGTTYLAGYMGSGWFAISRVRIRAYPDVGEITVTELGDVVTIPPDEIDKLSGML